LLIVRQAQSHAFTVFRKAVFLDLYCSPSTSQWSHPLSTLLLNRISIILSTGMLKTPDCTLSWRYDNDSALPYTDWLPTYFYCSAHGSLLSTNGLSFNAKKSEAINFSSRQNCTSGSQHTDINLSGSKIRRQKASASHSIVRWLFPITSPMSIRNQMLTSGLYATSETVW